MPRIGCQARPASSHPAHRPRRRARALRPSVCLSACLFLRRSLLQDDEENFPWCRCSPALSSSPYRLRSTGMLNNYKPRGGAGPGQNWVCFSAFVGNPSRCLQPAGQRPYCCDVNFYKVEFNVSE